MQNNIKKFSIFTPGKQQSIQNKIPIQKFYEPTEVSFTSPTNQISIRHHSYLT